MNDKRMDQLVRMAMEADELEFGPAADAPPMLRLVGVGDDQDTEGFARRRGWWIGAGVLAAAGIALASALPLMLRPTAPSGPTIVKGQAPTTVEVAHEAPKFRRHQSLDGLSGGTTPVWVIPEYALSREPEVCAPAYLGAMARGEDRFDPGNVQKCVVVAIYRDDHGSMHCAKVQPQEWSGNKCLSEVTPQEIRTVPLGQACSPAASRTLVVAMAGPQRALPMNEAEATGVARCILGGDEAHRGGSEDLRSIANAAAACVSPEVAVKVESIVGR